MPKDKDFQQEANKHGARFAESARDDLDALKHAQECDGTDENGKPCKRGSETKRVRVKGKSYTQCLHQNPEAWHDEDTARRTIDEAPLSIEVRSDWNTPGDEDSGKPTEYRVLLGTGGPAMQIVGELNEYGQPETAVYQYQDWFKPWTDAHLTEEEDAAILEWVQQLYFGE